MFAESTEEGFQSDTTICTFNLLSSCTKGRKCHFLHDIPNNMDQVSTARKDPCYFFLKGRCDDGDSCQRSHSEPPSFNGTIKKVCLYFSQSRCDRGKLCSYSHDLPLDRSQVSIIVDSQSSSNQSENINAVPPVVINTSDDDQCMVVTPKLCRFYLRGMCFFGENCLNFHDKPEKDPEDFISDLRKDEVLNEKNELDKIDSPAKGSIDSNYLPVVLTKNEEIDFNAFKVVHRRSNLSRQQRKSRKVINNSSKSEEFRNVPYDSPRSIKLPSAFDSSSKINEVFSVSSCHSAKSGEVREDLCSSSTSDDLAKDMCKSAPHNPQKPSTFEKLAELTKDLYISSKSVVPHSSSHPKEFSKASNNNSHSKQNVKSTYSSTKSKEFYGEPKTSLKPREFARGTHIFSQSKEFVKDTYSSDEKEFIRDSHRDSSKSKEHSKSRHTCSYSQTKKFSNVSFNYTKSKKSLTTQYSLKQRGLSSSRYADSLPFAEQSKNADDSSISREFTRNSERLKKHPENSSYQVKLEQFRNVVNSKSPIEQFKIAVDLRPIKTKDFINITNLSNSERPKEHPGNSNYPIKLEQCRNVADSTSPIEQSKIAVDLRPIKTKDSLSVTNSNKQSNTSLSNSASKTQFTVTTGGSNTKPEMNCHMTRKQSKSQRKLKSENTQSRIFYRRMFFKTPVPVTRVTKN